MPKLAFPVSLVGKKDTGYVLPEATTAYGAGDVVLKTITGNPPANWLINRSDLYKLEVGTSTTVYSFNMCKNSALNGMKYYEDGSIVPDGTIVIYSWITYVDAYSFQNLGSRRIELPYNNSPPGSSLGGMFGGTANSVHVPSNATGWPGVWYGYAVIKDLPPL